MYVKLPTTTRCSVRSVHQGSPWCSHTTARVSRLIQCRSSNSSSSEVPESDLVGEKGQGVAPTKLKSPRPGSSSWDAKESVGGKQGQLDYLHALGKRQDYNINVDHGQSSAYIDTLFTGDGSNGRFFLGHKTDIADGSLRDYEFRSFNHLFGEYYVSPRFSEAIACHVVKNFFAEDIACPVPLILAIWGDKGAGKTMQTELTMKKMGIEPIVMSAGELESEIAGRPGEFIRTRYRHAGEVCRTRGKLSALVINDIDAGLGRMGNTQVTVNNQIVQATLMNLCDNPIFVSLGQSWGKAERRITRVPIIVTGNDLSTLFAPLIRDGRMDKFYWKANRDELFMTLYQMFKEDLGEAEIETLIDTFPEESLSFFGHVRQSCFDESVRQWSKDVVSKDNDGMPVYDPDLTDILVTCRPWHELECYRDPIPEEFAFQMPPITLAQLIERGHQLVAENKFVDSIKLAPEYMKMMKGSAGGIGFGG